MSKLFAKTYIWEKEIDKEELRASAITLGKVRYLKFTKEFHFQCLDVITWLTTKDHQVEKADFKISESEINRFFKFDVMYKDAKPGDIDYKTVKKLELEGMNFYDDVYFGLCFVQFFFYLTKDILKEVKRTAHTWALGRRSSPWMELTPIPLNRHGGRPVGSQFGDCRLNRTEKERLLDNLSRYDKIVEKYAASEVSLLKFVEMHKELRKLGNLLPEWMQKPFMLKEEGLTWYWHAIRYGYKKQHGLQLDPDTKKIKSYQKAYCFPFEEDAKI